VNEENFGDQRFNTTLEDVIIWTGVTNVPAYKTTKLVMRKIPARGANFIMGRNDGDLYNTSHDNFEPHQVSFTNDFYIGVFEFTYGQAETLYAKLPTKPGYSIIFTNSLDKSMRPVLMRASHTRAGLAKWPWGGREETANTLIKVLRDRTNILFDLPTEAQWEYACRAGTTTDWNCGLSSQSGNEPRKKMLQSIISRCSYNSGFTPSNLGGNSTNYNVRAEVGGTAFPGCYAPNAWGLYDMHGNMSELCLDYYVDDLSNYGGDDPWGPSPGDGIENLNCRVRRGGTFYLCNQYNCVSSRGQNDASTASSFHGGRVCFMVYE
jgi:formylglycine-generating enzyme required for sulfatase activity